MEQKKRLLVLVVILLVLNLVNLLNITDLTGKAVETATGIASLCFNRPPNISAIPDQIGHYSLNFTLNITASDTNGFTFHDNSTLFEINRTAGLINFTPSASQLGNHSIVITAADNASDCPFNSTDTFLLEIVNSAPNLSTTIPNQTWEINVQLSFDLDNYFSDVETGQMNYTATYGSHINLSISGLGVVTIRPNTGWNGTSWVIFTANDSLETTDSNNVTLNVTDVADFCGDGACNSGETCSSCSTDCGSCPAGIGGGGGGGGRTTIIEKILREAGEAFCEIQTECTAWLPESCVSSEKQRQSCITVEQNCRVVEKTDEQDCICQPRWECSFWLPDDCRDGFQQRTCLDLNGCNIERDLPLQRTCTSSAQKIAGEEGPGRGALAGQAFFPGAQQALNDMALLLVIIVTGALVAFLYAYSLKRRKDAQRQFAEATKPRSPEKKK